VTADRVIRLLPALVLSSSEAAQIVSILTPLVKQFLAQD
jgi:acetylornithine aminotransferase